MTDEQIIELLATKVMGWEKKMSPPDYVIGPEWYWWSDGEPIAIVSSWNPLKHIQHAWMLVEKLRKELCRFTLDSDHDFVWEAYGIRDEDDEDHWKCVSDWKIHVSHKSICRAIALAALKAHGVEVI